MRWGKLLFTQRYLLPFEMVSVLLLVGMLGVILLSRRELK
jgi:NADH:ubiquinone oxidoreductase subunit 6 (subunit J)